jgi:hypothetical protein
MWAPKIQYLPTTYFIVRTRNVFLFVNLISLFPPAIERSFFWAVLEIGRKQFQLSSCQRAQGPAMFAPSRAIGSLSDFAAAAAGGVMNFAPVRTQ